MAVAAAGPYATHLHLTPDNHASTSSFNFCRPDDISEAQPNSVKALKATIMNYYKSTFMQIYGI